MPSDKDRLYVALYARGGTAHLEPGSDERYHWALLTGPKEEMSTSRGMRYHARDSIHGDWRYEEKDIGSATSMMLLGRVVVAKVVDNARLQAAFRGVAIVQGDKSWNCVAWVRQALEALKADGKAVGTSQLEWEVVRKTAMDYLARKTAQHRYDGLAPDGRFDMEKKPTYDLLEGRETVE
ncbi:MAG: hypothetical protein Q9220_002207 [cf. Caloplaca sp. 1 TL-2023]